MKNTLKKLKKAALPVILCLAVVAGTLAFGLIGHDKKEAEIEENKAGTLQTVTLLAPELIYLLPSDQKTFQYFVNDCDSSYAKSIEANATQTTGYFSFTGPSSATVTSLTCTGATINSTASGTNLSGHGFTISSNKITGSITASTSSLPSAKTQKSSTTLTWTVTYNISGQNGLTATAYTECYAPYQSVGTSLENCYDGRQGTTNSGHYWYTTWISGIHEIYNIDSSKVSDKLPAYSSFSGSDASDKGYYDLISEPLKDKAHSAVARTTYFGQQDTSLLTSNNSANNMDYYYHAYYNSGGADSGLSFIGGNIAGRLYVDTSRYTQSKTYNNIPNFNIGFDVISSNAEIDDNALYAGYDLSSSYNTKKYKMYDTSSSDANYYSKIPNQYFTYVNGTSKDNMNNLAGTRNSATAKSKLANTVDASYTKLSAITFTKLRCQNKGTKVNSESLCNTYCDIVYSDKTKLREAYLDAISSGRQASYYTTTSWDNYNKALIAVAKNLEQVDVSADSSLVTTLNAARNNLSTYYYVSGNNGTLTGSSSKEVKIGSASTVSVTPSSDGFSATRTGYTQNGWSTNSSTSTGSTSVTVGFNQYVYAVWTANNYYIQYDDNKNYIADRLQKTTDTFKAGLESSKSGTVVDNTITLNRNGNSFTFSGTKLANTNETQFSEYAISNDFQLDPNYSYRLDITQANIPANVRLQFNMIGDNWSDPITFNYSSTAVTNASKSLLMTFESDKLPKRFKIEIRYNGTTSVDLSQLSFKANLVKVQKCTYDVDETIADVPAKTGYSSYWSAREYLVDDSASYTATKQFTISAPFNYGETYVMECDVVSNTSSLLRCYFYSGDVKLSNKVANEGATYEGNLGDGRMIMPTTSTTKHVKVTYTMASSGDVTKDKNLLFRNDGSGSFEITNIKFYRQFPSNYNSSATVKNLTAIKNSTVTMTANWTANDILVTIDPGDGMFTANKAFLPVKATKTGTVTSNGNSVNYTIKKSSDGFKITGNSKKTTAKEVTKTIPIFVYLEKGKKYKVSWTANNGISEFFIYYANTQDTSATTFVTQDMNYSCYKGLGTSTKDTLKETTIELNSAWAPGNDKTASTGWYGFRFDQNLENNNVANGEYTFSVTDFKIVDISTGSDTKILIPADSTRTISASRTGYTHNGWSITSGPATVSNNILNAGNAASTLTANWTANKYTVSFDSQGGTASESKTVVYDSTYGTLPEPTRPGYHFEGWYKTQS